MCYSEAGSSASGQILPTRVLEPSVFGGKVRVYAWGKPLDWNKMVTDSKLDQFEILARYAKECGIRRVFTPLAFENPDLQGRALLIDRVVGTVIDDDPDLYRDKIVVNETEFYFGGDGDGVRLHEPGAYFLPSANCYALVFRMRTGLVVGCHGARASLVEPAAVRAIDHSNYQSVVYSALSGWYNRVHDLQTAMFLGIQPSSFPHPFNHPVYGPANKEMCEYLQSEFGPETVLKPFDQGMINLPGLVKYQLERLGAPIDSRHFYVDPTDTATETDKHGGFVWHSNRRGDTTRNGVLVVRLP